MKECPEESEESAFCCQSGARALGCLRGIAYAQTAPGTHGKRSSPYRLQIRRKQDAASSIWLVDAARGGSKSER